MQTYKDKVSGETLYVDAPFGGSVYYYKDAEEKILHRVDGPAIERYDDTKYWYQNNKRHRIDGPAIIYKSGSKFWYVDGVWIDKFDLKSSLNEFK